MEKPTRSFQAPTQPNSTPKVLLVEDDSALARGLGRLLGQSGFEITHAGDGVVASEALTTQTFDLVLSDISLPGANGIELLQLVRAYDLDVPVILMTGNPNVETAMQAVELGALRYLPKPLDMAQLQTMVRQGVMFGRLARAKREALDTTDGAKQIGDRAGLIVRFKRALSHLRLAFQPIVDARQRKIVAYEVLLRSSEPSLPDPRAVLEAAERLDAIHELGRAIRRLAADALRALPTKDALLFLNVHAKELTDPELYESSPLDAEAHRIVLEVTERASLESIKDAPNRARRLRDAGYQLGVDDFGGGYAGLATFAKLEPEFVKLDLSLIRDIGQSVTKQRIVRSTIELCRELSIRVIAEGVETREELACVIDLGCDLVQGYYLGRPRDTPALALSHA